MKQNILIVANGDVDRALVDKVDLQNIDVVVAADGGAPKALACALTPHVVIGDFDSLPIGFQEQYKQIRFLHRPSQELNDLEKALLYCKEEGAEKIVLIGITSDRVDHTMNNFSVLAKYADEFQFEIFSPQGKIYLVRQTLKVNARKDQTVSLIPLGRTDGVKTAGLRYPLNNETLALGEREGASNSAVDGPFSVSIAGGALLVFVNDVD